MWMTVGEYFRLMGMDFPVESFKIKLRTLHPEHLEGSRPHRYRREDLDRAYQAMCDTSLYLRRKMMK